MSRMHSRPDRYEKPRRRPSTSPPPDTDRRRRATVDPRTSPTQDGSRPRYVPSAPSDYANPIFNRQTEDPEDSSGSVSDGGFRSRSQDLAAKFVRKVPIHDLKACQRYLRQHPAVLNDTNMQQYYLEPAIEALATDDVISRRMAFNYMEKFTLIKAIQAFERAGRGNFLELLISNDAEAVKAFKSACDKVKVDWEREARSRQARQSAQRFVGGEDEALTERAQALSLSSRDSRASQSEHHQTLASRHGPSAPNTQAAFTSHRSSSQSPLHGSAEDENDRASEGGRTTRPAKLQATISDKRFQKLSPREWSYFRIGRVFAIKTYSEHNSQPDVSRDDFSVEKGQTTRGTEVVEYIRRMVIVSARSGFCLAVPINTYGGKGLHKPSFRQNNIGAHARIYMSDRLPKWIDWNEQAEPRTAKRDIEVHPVSGQQLHPASRICFERTHSIDYNEKIMKMGTVTTECLRYLEEYWIQETGQPATRRDRKG